MPKPKIKQIELIDFTGGLNLRANPLQLADNETGDCLDVDVDPRGGVARRKGTTAMFTGVTGSFDGLWLYQSSNGAQQRMCALRSGSNSLIKNLDDTGQPTVQTVPAGPVRAVTFNDLCYIVSDDAVPTRWNGSAANGLGALFYDLDPGPDATVGGNMPKAKLIATWQNCVWVANTNESSVGHPSRVRYSWPGQAEYWGTENYFDLDTGDAGDEIVAIIPHGERLLVFKRNSVYAIHGYSPDTFERQQLTQTVGTISQETVCRSDSDVFFVDWPHGVYRIPFNGRPELISDNIDPVFSDGLAPASSRSTVSASWMNGRLWVGVPWAAAAQGRTFVFDPRVGKTGAWTAYSFKVDHGIMVYPSNEAVYPLAAIKHSSATTTGKLATLDVTSTQDLGAYRVPAYYFTKFHHASDPMSDKKWRRVGAVFEGTRIDFSAYTTLGRTQTAAKHFSLTGSVSAGSGVWGQAWGSMLWSASTADDLNVDQGGRAGRGKALALRFSCPNDELWAVTAITLKFELRRRRD